MTVGIGRSARSRRGGRVGPELVTIYWRDIPAQVTATDDHATMKELLPARFQHAIDRAAAVAGLTEAHAYVSQWRREARSFEGDAGTVATAEAARLGQEYRKRRLDDLVRHGGLADP